MRPEFRVLGVYTLRYWMIKEETKTGSFLSDPPNSDNFQWGSRTRVLGKSFSWFQNSNGIAVAAVPLKSAPLGDVFLIFGGIMAKSTLQ